MNKFATIAILTFCLFVNSASAQNQSLAKRLDSIVSSKKATVGVSVHIMETRDKVLLNGN